MNPQSLSLKPLILWLKAERPINWQTRFGRETTLEVEIGFGYGEFLVRLAQTNPERNFVGLELKWASVRKALRNIAQARTPNVRLIQADARVAFDRLFLPKSVHRVYALFPDPWPKTRHAKHRLFSHTVLKLLNSRLVSGGEIRIITDCQPYLSWIVEQAPGTGFESYCQSIPPRFGTKYERKWHENGQQEFYEMRLLKRDHLEIPLKEDTPLKTLHVEHFDPDRFQPTNERGDSIADFKEFLYDPKRQKGMLMVVVSEENLTQHFWIEIGQKRGRWYIRPSKGCGVVPTMSVQRALDLVRDAMRR
ncbi:MAG: tRNA (guanosine(46)-N7)-methyltransferase TrmB [Deltaproteobacteria bacterium]|nr:tRNA (guanosine(46)-N7)-methyltransferase TrmB [Deltaproteobacteria bacterium]